MKTKHIIILIAIVLAIGVIISTFADASTYSDFDLAAKNPGKELHVIGKLDTTKTITYDPKNPNYLAFYLIDGKGNNRKVVYNNSKPQDFEKSEQVVLVGRMEGDEFKASSMLLKCPSKYNDEEKPQAFNEKKF
jgi:cytochrome c-type biogenesis protein CcmE